MFRRILAAVLIVLGLTAIGLGVASATVWRSSDHVTAVMPESPTTPVVLTMPGVMSAVDDHVTVTATASSDDLPIVLTFARAGDTLAWVDDASHTRITGLSEWDLLAVEEVAGESDSVPAPTPSDLWTTTLDGTGTLTVDLTPDNGQVIMMAATDGTEPAPALTFTWQVPVTTPYLIPLVVAGSILALAGVALLVYGLLVSRELRQRDAAREEHAAREERRGSETQVMMPKDASSMTRRQLRELQRRLREEDPRHASDGPVASTAGAVGSGVVPGVADPERHRALRYVVSDDSGELRAIPDDLVLEIPEPDDGSAATWSAEERSGESGRSFGAGIVPGRAEESAARENNENPSERAGGTYGAGIVPSRVMPEDGEIASGSSDAAADGEQSQPTAEAPGRTSWRALWGLKEEETR